MDQVVPVHCVASRIPWNTVSFAAPLSPMKELPHSLQITLHFRATQQSSSSGKHENKLRHFCLLEYTTEVLRLRSLFQWDFVAIPRILEDNTPKIIFSDGSCFFPKDRQFSIAGSAAITADSGSHEFRLLNVLWFREQTIPHIELKFLVLFWP